MGCPPDGAHLVLQARVKFANGETLHSNAMVFGDVDQAMPVRTFTSTSGEDATSSLLIDSAPGDLVVNVVGQGSGILEPGRDGTRRFVANVDSSYTMNNSAGSTSPGASHVESTWIFGASDQWQSLSVSLRPSPL